jgi:hypothetical protein
MTRRKQVYEIAYPNRKIYVGMDLTGSVTYVGSPSAKAQIAADLGETPTITRPAKRFSGSQRKRHTQRSAQWRSS